MRISSSKDQKQKIPLYMWFLILLFLIGATAFIWIPVGTQFINDKTAQTRTCTIQSAQVDSSTGGPKSATKHESVFIHTTDCGMIYISRLHNMNVSSFEELSTKINERKGQALTFHIGKLQLSSDSTRAERVDL